MQRLLVANRGEIAVRVIRAAHELGIEAVAVYSTADEGALHTRLADRAVRVGPPPASQSYLNIPSIIAAATTTGCDAVHPGYGFLAENPAFVHACEENDLAFVGPGADVMARMGDKAQAKAEMRAADVPLVPGSAGPVSYEDALTVSAQLGFPVLLKAAAGGGGRGMRLVESPMVGTFYRAAQPGAAPFVEEGDAVAAGQTLCILEAMKLMNEVKSEHGGIVRAIHKENADAVQFGDLLFELEPLNGRPLDAY